MQAKAPTSSCRRKPLTSSFRRRPESISGIAVIPRKRESILLVRCTLAERSSLLGFARHPWRASHFLCLHKESNQRNAPSVTRRPRSGRFAAVGRGLAAGLLPCRQMRAVLARTACGARGLFRPTFAASQRGQHQEQQKQKLLRQEPRFSLASPGPLQVAASRRRKSPKGRRQDAGEFADSTWTYCRQTPEPARAVTRAGMPA